MVRVDNNGNPQSNGVDTSYNVYVETAASVSPTFDAIWVHNKPYVITSSEVIEKKVQVGYSKISDEPVELAAKTGNKLWRLDIGEPASIKKASSFITATSIVIEGKSNNRSFYFKVAKERELKDINGQ
jgi:outer membrane protein assembly factor BamB